METVLRFAPKQQRASNPKVRTGCATCKKRRVKCDETKPVCIRCQSGARKCEYPDLKPITRKRRPQNEREEQDAGSSGGSSMYQPILPRPNIPESPSSYFAHSHLEGTFFQSYRDMVADSVGGTSGVSFFTVFVLRECHSSVIIRDLILAMSSFNRANLNTSREREDNLRFAISHQSKAIHALRDTLFKSPNQIRLAIIASILLTCNECLQGNYHNSKQQLISGINLLKNWVATKGTSINGVQIPSLIDDDILVVFPKLQNAVVNYFTMSAPHDPCISRHMEKAVIPEKFASLEDASFAAKSILDMSNDLWGKVERLKRVYWPPQYPENILERSGLLLDLCNRWTAAITPLLEIPGVAMHPIYLLLSMGIGVTRIFQQTSLEAAECVNDLYLPDYQHLVNLARLAMSSVAKARKEAHTPYGTEVILPLCYMATRCRDWTIRDEARAIMREFPAQNNVWDYQCLTLLVDWVYDLEREAMDETGYVPEEKRVRLHTRKWMMEQDGLHAEVMQGGLDDATWILRHTVLKMPERSNTR